MIGQLEIRPRNEGEEVPAELMVGLEPFQIVELWQWVVLDDNKIVAQVLTAPAHGVLILLRMMSLPEAPKGWLVLALRRILTNAKALGLIGYMVLLQDSKPQEVKMMRIVQKSGGMLLPFSGVIAVGSSEVKY